MNLFGHLVGLLGRGISPTQGLYLHRTTRHRKKCGHTSMPRAGCEPAIPIFERPKTVRALDRAVIGTSKPNSYNTLFSFVRELFEKFVDSPYYSELELCGGAVTVSFSKYLPGQAMHFLQHSTHFSKTCCRPLITSKLLASELPFHGWKCPKIVRREIWTVWRMF
jgi:hypothetical protein